MNKNKQIDEMAKLICTYPQCIHHNIIGECANTECNIVDIAENLYAKGYRKQSEGHWYKHDKKKHGDTCYYCSVCEKMALADCMTWELTDYCPNCGARMKGGETDAREAD